MNSALNSNPVKERNRWPFQSKSASIRRIFHEEKVVVVVDFQICNPALSKMCAAASFNQALPTPWDTFSLTGCRFPHSKFESLLITGYVNT